jgi:hypothetical protein
MIPPFTRAKIVRFAAARTNPEQGVSGDERINVPIADLLD